ncbi:beta-lactamase family protein [Chryseobacterium sp. RG1]|uniref:Beta-lactamase family protein n=1 Tax=Chryseobacterium tagetis TaxID=2801334 RepID=A0ABS8A3I6_9FLAO|nr:serine hydrolase [Chryseobacterium tagetis]MCA6068518.1 beta-lactamase family protein [Chryseobacterium tagetis]
MKIKKIFSVSIFFFALVTCSSDSENPAKQRISKETPGAIEAMYFPPSNSDNWETKSISSLGWHQDKVQDLLDYLQTKNSKSFIILQNGRIVIENYFGGHTSKTPWYWASAGKTLTSTVTGIAEQEGFLNINNKVSAYIGTGWTSEPLAKENLITCKNLLTMTSGLDDSKGNDVSTENLQYKADASTRWAYHNVYVKLQDVVAAATGQSWSQYFNTKLRDKIGMTGIWVQSGSNSVYWSTTRSMARFGLMALNKGNWNGNQIINTNYFQNATSTSQNINLAYGYLWWLNGKTSYHVPQTQIQFTGKLIPSAPDDLFCALGKNDQKIYVVPSKKLVIIRMGNSADRMNFARSDFDEVLWQKINAVIN